MGVLLALQGEVAEYPAHAFTEITYLNEFRLHGIPKTYRNQQKYQNVV